MSQGQEDGLFADRPLMTVRISHDSGKTWGPEQAVFTTDGLEPLVTTAWPPCQCAGCAGRGKS